MNLTILERCRKIGCWWNSIDFFSILPEAKLEGGELFDHAPNRAVRIHYSGNRLKDFNEWLNITLSVNITKKQLIKVTYTLPFDKASCLRGAKDKQTRVLSATPLLYLAKPAVTDAIHDHLVDTPLLEAPTTTPMSHDLIRMLRQVPNTPPQFDSLFYLETLEENNPLGVIVARVEAKDPDLGVNGQVTYSLVAADGDESVLSLFDIDPQMGVITVTSMFTSLLIMHAMCMNMKV